MHCGYANRDERAAQGDISVKTVGGASKKCRCLDQSAEATEPGRNGPKTDHGGRTQGERAAQDARTLEAEKELRPMLRNLHELLLTGSDLSTIRRSFEQKGFPPRKNIEKSNTELRAILRDSLVRSGLKIVPALYDRCEECREFLARRQSLRPKLAASFEKCQGAIITATGSAAGCYHAVLSIPMTFLLWKFVE